MARSHSSVGSLKSSSASEAAGASGESDDDSGGLSFEHSPFGQLLGMLASPVIRRNSVLTDKLLRLLSLISLGQPDILKKKQSSTPPTTTTAESTTTTSAAATGNGSENKDSSAEPSAGSAEPSAGTSSKPNNVIRSEHLKLAVEVLTSKTCSEEGLEDVTALLLNLSYGPEHTRDTILDLLLQGAQELGSVVRQNILDLQSELQSLKTSSGMYLFSVLQFLNFV